MRYSSSLILFSRKRREIAALLEAELDGQFHIPARIRRMSKEYDIF